MAKLVKKKAAKSNKQFNWHCKHSRNDFTDHVVTQTRWTRPDANIAVMRQKMTAAYNITTTDLGTNKFQQKHRQLNVICK